MIIPKSTKKFQVKTPGGKSVRHLKRRRPSYGTCKKCGKKLNRAKLDIGEIRKLSKTEKRPERPFPELCSRCMREYFKEKVR